MKREIKRTLLFLWTLQLIVSLLGYTPRLIIRSDDVVGRRLRYSQIQQHTVLFHPEGSDDLFIGGTNIVYRIDLEHNRLVENFTLTPTSGQNCQETQCQNIITVIEQFQDSLFVCGTNANMPVCWKVYPKVDNQTSRVIKTLDGTGISPPVYTQNSLSLTVDGDLYAATPLSRDGTSLQFRRKAGRRTNVWMHDKWLTEPTFISASWVRRREDPDQEKIYVFFREKNLDPNPDADPWISRIGRVCKVDEGGPKRYFQSMWTSFLKARLVCGIQGESLYFNRLQDIFVQHAEDWRTSRVYGLFTSRWNATAVCIYSMDQIDQVFEKSSFRGFSEGIPDPRPGACVEDSRNIPVGTLRIIKEHPEMSDWIQPIHQQAPLYISNNNYTRIAVDTVTAANGHPHNVMFLATDEGLIHRILEDNFTPFIISEINLSNHSSPVQSMKLLSNKKKLVVGFLDQVAQLNLQSCQGYGGTCADCVLARDPYCAWSEAGCAPVVPGSIQNIAGATVDVCHQTGSDQQRHRPPPPDPPGVNYSLPLGVPVYLSCPVRSRHASYTWEHQGWSSQCGPAQTHSDCLHLIPAVREEHYGVYQCISTEQNYSRVLKLYRLHPSGRSGASASRHALTAALMELALLSLLCH
ncbi:hypothetical protein AAFF_G00224480 [Aldrovandia affinis]|uniref:Uncharacterized protein n=1 Tax=Aldrovandia affinis TaxID=143900 RepID=A0AAD7TAY9_9TELE|nr:hypothetical protein AAFF_G00224480 [Aldrovandia affinis]